MRKSGETIQNLQNKKIKSLPDFRVISKAKLEVPNLGHLRGIKSSICVPQG